MPGQVVVVGNLTVDDVVDADGGVAYGQLGGNAVYAALGARLWASHVGLVTRHGTDLPAHLLPTLRRLGLGLDGVVATDSLTARSWLLYEHDGRRTFVDRAVPDESTRWVQPGDLPPQWLTDDAVVHVAPMPLAVTTGIAVWVKQSAPSATVVVDPHEDWRADGPLLAELARAVDVFAPSVDELTTLAGTTDPRAGAEHLLLLGFPAVVVKLGADGALVADGSGAHLVPAVPARVVDVTGAGDTFCGALAGSLAAGSTLHEATVRAAHTAAWSLEARGSLALAPMTPAHALARLEAEPVPRRVVAVLGSARLGEDDPRWQEAYELGHALGDAGWAVMTGGYGGLMAATAAGAAEAGAVVIGLPMTAWVGLEPSEHASELRWSRDYAERLSHILGADVVVALPGGIGTLAEATIVWSALQTEPGAARLVLLGKDWRQLSERFADHLVVAQEDLRLARVADDAAAAVAAVEEAYLDTTATAGPRG
jgi:uncharacterized protein (TIGR00725 family)